VSAEVRATRQAEFAGGEMPPEMATRQAEFENMSEEERAALLRSVATVLGKHVFDIWYRSRI